jgi:uncharacterized protein
MKLSSSAEERGHSRDGSSGVAQLAEIDFSGQRYFVGAIIMPFHLFTKQGKAYLFNVERVIAFEIEAEFASRLASYREADAVIPLRDFELLRRYRLIADSSSDLVEMLDGKRQYEGCIQTLVLNVVQGCNLRCGYCFAGDGSYGNKGKMPVDTAKMSIDWYANQHTYPSMEVNFFGGEPLANFPLICDSVEYARAVARDRGKEIAFSITTNGTLVTQRIAKFLAENKFRIAVSLDGPAEINDRNRPTASGGGSLDRVLNGLRILREAGNVPIARCTVHGETDMREVQRFLAAMKFEQVHVAKASLADGQEDKGALSAVISNAGLEAQAVVKGRQEGRNVVNSVSKLAALVVAGQRQTRACGVGDKIAAVGIDGGLYACHRFTNDEKWKIGDVEHGKYASRFVDRSVNGIGKCRTCWAKYLCGGGCRHDNYSATGDPFLPPDEFCLEMKAYSEEAIMIACDEKTSSKEQDHE